MISRLTPAQVETLRRCSKDDDAFRELLEMFEASPPPPDPGPATPLHPLAANLLETLADPLFVMDFPTRMLVFHNRALPSADRISALVHPDDVPILEDVLAYLQNAPEGTVGSALLRLKRGDGRYYWTVGRAVVISRTEDGSIGLVSGQLIDAKELQQTLDAGSTDHLRFIRLAESLPDTVFIFDRATDRAIYHNHPTLLGYPIAQLVTRQYIRAKIWPDDLPRLSDFWEEVYNHQFDPLNGSPTFAIEYQLQSASGGWEWIHQRATIIAANAMGHADQVLVMMSVITDRKRTEQALIQSEARHRDLLDKLPIAVSVTDRATYELVFTNRAYQALIAANPGAGFSLDEWAQTLSPADRAIAVARRAALQRGEAVPPFDYHMVYNDGTVHINRTHPLLFDFENRPAILTITEDVTAQKQVETALRESEYRYRVLSEALDFAVQYDLQPDGTLRRVWMAGRFEEVTGYPREEFDQRGGIALITHPNDLSTVLETFTRLTQTPSSATLEYRIITKAGHVRHMWGNAISVADAATGQVTQVFAIAQDITERVEMRNSLIEQARFVRQIADAVPAIILLYDFEQGCSVWANRYLGDLFGLPTEALLFVQMGTDSPVVHPDDSAPLGEAITRWRNDASDEAFEAEFRMKRPDGVFRWIHLRGVVFERDSSGVARTIITVLLDITEQKEAQADRVQTDMLQMALQKEHELNELKSKMMQRISHEFRTPLAIILSSSYVLQRVDPRVTEDKRQRHFSSIQAQIARVVAMLEDIQFIVHAEAQYHTVFFTTTALGPFINEAIEKASAAFYEPRQVIVELTPAASLPIPMESFLLGMILTNLISNALKFSEGHKAIYVTGDILDSMLCIEVRDEGIGIPDEDLPHIFEPFYRANNFDEKPGLGLGLTIVQNALELYGGTIAVESAPGNGSTFRLTLPLSAPPRPPE